jgi:phage terminase small subunit
MLWRDMRGRTKEIHKELQDIDSLCSPHLEERWIGENIDLDLLSLFLQKYARFMRGMEEEGQAIQSQQWRREKPKNMVNPRRKKGYLYPLQK